jgi:hypothetical protein
MKTQIFQNLKFIITVFITIIPVAISAQNITISGEITADTTWSADTVKVIGDILVQDDITLTIDPGTYVEFQGHYTLEIRGTLLAVGNETDNIVFTINDTTGFSNPDTTQGGWNKIWFNNHIHIGAHGAMNDNDTSRLSFCRIQYSKNIDSTYWEYSPAGGAISILAFSKLVISECKITHNMSELLGGGITCNTEANIIIKNNLIDSNLTYVWGGGICCMQSKPIIAGNIISNNKVIDYLPEKSLFGTGGGGIFCYKSEAIIQDNQILKNTASGGAGIGSLVSRNIIENNIISDNHTSPLEEGWWWVGGGGIYSESSIDLIRNNKITNNTANSGGGIRIAGNETFVINNLIVNNSCKYFGGALIISDANPLMVNNTISNNHSLDECGGIDCERAVPLIVNSIIWGNTQDDAGQGSQIRLADGFSNPDIYYSLIQDGSGDFSGNYQGTYQNNLDQDPGFVMPAEGSGNGYNGLEADWSLTVNSPCLNNGDPDVKDLYLPAYDIYNKKRIKHGRIDIGASEVTVESINISGNIDKDTILIADTINVTGDLYVNDDYTLLIVPGAIVQFRGHYKLDVQGTIQAIGHDSLPVTFTIHDTTGFSNNDTTLGGWQGIKFNNESGVMLDNDTSILEYCCITFVKTDRDFDPPQQGAIGIRYFNKIRIQHSTINHNNSYFKGGGIFCERSNPAILNNEISYNYSQIGGGLYISDSEPIIKNNKIIFNSSNNDGGGINCGGSKVYIENNLIYQNFTPHGRGAGMVLHACSGIVKNNQIINNTSFIWGGGIACQEGIGAYDEMRIINNMICNNFAGKGAGIFFMDTDDAIVVNNTICNNYSYDVGGGVSFNTSSPALINNIIWGNTDNYSTQVIIDDDVSVPSFDHCNIQDSINGILRWYLDTTFFPFQNNINAVPHFTYPTEGSGPGFDALNADFRLLPISECIDAGIENLTGLGLPDFDIYSKPRIHNQIIDIGAAENQDALAIITEQPANQIVCEGDSVRLNIATPDSVYIQWQKDGIDIPDAVTTVMIIDSITIYDEGNYQCILTNAYGKVKSTQAYIMVRKAPEILIEPASQWIQQDEPYTLKVYIDGTSPLSYQWKKDGSDIPGAVIPEYKIPSPDYTHEGDYTCNISNACGMVVTTPATIYLAPRICMVTVSTITGNNLVIWEKNSIAPLTAYNIYRESTAAGIYDLMDTVPYNNLSIYEDTTADPTKRAYIYKITGVDSSGYETDLNLCKPHKTIHLLVSTNPELKSTQLAWDKYYGFDYQTYNIYRSSTGTNFTVIDAMPSTLNSWTDPEAVTGELYYRVAVEKPVPCLPAGSGKKAESGPYSHSMSNMDDNRLQAGENPPDTITLSNNTINENNSYGMLIGRFNTNDADSLDTHTYSLVRGEGDDDNTSFTILGDMLLAAEIFDFEQKNVCSVRVRCTDKGNLTREEVFTIQVNDVIETGIADHPSSNRIQVYPNPFNKSTTLLFNNPEGHPYTLYIMDLSGKVCRIVDNINTSRYVLEKKDLKEGFYFIELQGTRIFRGKIIIE